MEIEITAPKEILEEFRLHFHDQLLAAEFTQGPKIDSVESGIIIEYLKGNQIVCLEIKSELEGKNSIMHVEANQEIPELKELWGPSGPELWQSEHAAALGVCIG